MPKLLLYHRPSFAGLLFVLLSIPFQPGTASTLSAEDQIVETMIQAQGADATALGRFFGGDTTARLNFTSFVNVSGNTFSYSLLPGAMYLSQPLTMTDSGFLDRAGVWHWTTSASLGARSWTTTGTGQFGDPTIDPPNFDVFVDLDPNDDYHTDVTYEQTAARTVSVETTTFTMRDILSGKDVVVGTTQRFDTYMLQGPDKGKWVWDAAPVEVNGHAFGIHSDGFAPVDGGAGNFTVTFTPEPSSLLLSSSVLFLGIVRKRFGKR